MAERSRGSEEGAEETRGAGEGGTGAGEVVMASRERERERVPNAELRAAKRLEEGSSR